MQTGIDGPIATSSLGTVSLGGFLHYGQVDIDGTNQTMGGSVGSYDTIAYGGGITATMMSVRDVYLDTVATYTRYDLDMHTAANGSASTSANGWSVSGELGWKLALSENTSVTPQAQLIHQLIAIENLSDQDGVHSSFNNSDSLAGRVSIHLQTSPKAGVRVSGEIGFVHEFLGAPKVAVSGTVFALSFEETAYLIDLGVQWDWGSDMTSWIEGGYRASFDRGNRESLSLTAGIKHHF